MSVNIQFSQKKAVYTNLDIISGKVILHLNREESFTAINVKLEGESRTRLAHPLGTRLGDRRETEFELHKVLYNVQTVFPTTSITSITNAKSYTLPPGSHEFPFSFKIPFNNACNPNNVKTLKIAGLAVDVQGDINAHVKKILPPTLSGFPGEAEVKYFVKVTAERPSLLRENFRSQVPFKFLPIEPPRVPANTRETYGRRKHQFSVEANPSPVAKKGGLKNLYCRKQSAATAPDGNSPPPQISVDVRLPDPAILTRNEPLPLRVLVTKLNDSPYNIFLRSFQVTLWAYTQIRARELTREEMTSWVICSYARMNEKLNVETVPVEGGANGGDADKKDPSANGGDLYPMLVPRRLWAKSPLPGTVPPGFSTCNLSRRYEVEISVGLGWGTPNDIRPELTVQPIRLPVSVYSGIAPSPALLAAVATNAGNTISPQIQSPLSPTSPPPPQPPRPGALGADLGAGAGVGPGPGPSSFSRPSASPAAQPGNRMSEAPAPAYDEPPPSYEDVMAETVAPVDGPRREYQVAESAPVTDGKRR